MKLSDPIENACIKTNGETPIVLGSQQATGETPGDFLSIDAHTQNYLTLHSNQNYGFFSGVAILPAIMLLVYSVPLLLSNEWREAGLFFSLGLFIVAFCLIMESCRKKFSLILFNRRTKEVYYSRNGKLFHTPWDNTQAVIHEHSVSGPKRIKARMASLKILVCRLGEPGTTLNIAIGTSALKDQKSKKQLWEYIRAYMNGGPLFDKYGNKSRSSTFIEEQRSAIIPKSKNLKYRYETFVDSLSSKDMSALGKIKNIPILIYSLVVHPSILMQEFIYRIAKDLAHHSWPEIVLERLYDGGPTTRLIDLERERGLDV